MSERLIEIEKRIKELEGLREPFIDEEIELEEEERSIREDMVREIAKRIEWRLEYALDKDGWQITLKSTDRFEKELDEIIKLAEGWYHTSFRLATEVIHGRDGDYNDDHVSLFLDDRQVYIMFDTVDNYKKYSEEWKLRVDTSDVHKTIEELIHNAEILKSLLEADK